MPALFSCVPWDLSWWSSGCEGRLSAVSFAMEKINKTLLITCVVMMLLFRTSIRFVLGINVMISLSLLIAEVFVIYEVLIILGL